MKYADELDRCQNFGDVFDLVKKAVKQILGQGRAGLMLILAELPMNVGAFHGLGSNAIVMNRLLLDSIVRSGKSKREINSFVYLILLHEYLHSLGHVDEESVRRLVCEIARKALGEAHPATEMAATGYTSILPHKPPASKPQVGDEFEIIGDFDRSNQEYIR